MFYTSSVPNLYQQVIRLTVNGHGKIYYINKDKTPYLEIEVDPNSWNPFNTECFFNDYFCVGNGENAYFVNLYTQEIKTLSCDMYFGYFYTNKGRLYVASNSQLFCLDSNCDLLWRSEKMAVDGVIVDQFLPDKIKVSCEVDPPGHWISYQLSIHDGKLLS